jgi:23S rRNA-/tRNA-specific pseudouridylate synthase
MGRLDLEHPDVVYNLEDSASGILLIAKNKEATKILKNAYGSYLFEFTFDLLCEKSSRNKEAEIACSLPIAHHTSREVMLISAKMGKKSYTAFNFIESANRYERWQAKCTYLRRDQICLHAHESGLAVLGDGKYGGAQIPLFAELKRNFKANRKKNNEFPYSGSMVHLSILKLHDGTIIHSELPKKMHTFMKFLENP